MTDAVLSASTFRPVPRRRSPFMRKAFPYFLVGPAVVYLLAITLYPGIFALWRSFYAGRFQLNYVGFDQYKQLFQDEAFWHSLSNTLIIGGLTLAIEFVIALGLAALVYRDPLVKGWRIIFLLPMLFMPSAVSFLWKLLFNDGRVISDLLMNKLDLSLLVISKVGEGGREGCLGGVWLACRTRAVSYHQLRWGNLACKPSHHTAPPLQSTGAPACSCCPGCRPWAPGRW